MTEINIHDINFSDRGMYLVREHANHCIGSVGNSTKQTESDLDQCLDSILEGLAILVDHHNATKFMVTVLKKQITQFMKKFNKSPSDWLKHIKYILGFPMAKYLHNEFPVLEGCFKPTGALRKWMKNRLNAFSRKNTHLWYSWLQNKRCSNMLPHYFQLERKVEHMRLLSEQPKDTSIVDKIMLNKNFIKVLDKTKEKINLKKNIDLLVSPNSCFERTIPEGGSRSEIIERMIKGGFLCQEVLVKMTDLVISTGSHYSHTVVEQYESDRSYEWSIEDLKRELIRDGTINQPLKALVHLVMEPLKIRVITKSNCFPYYFVKSIQREMLRSIQQFSCFKLTGEEINSLSLISIKKLKEKDDKWVSVDYKEATDRLNIDLSKSILTYITAGLDPLDQYVSSRVLGEHDIYHRFPVEVRVDGVLIEKSYENLFCSKMNNGQLMGSILSFPILCLANLGLYLYLRSQDNSLYDFENLIDSVLVNGDDMVYRGNEQLYDQHKQYGKEVGLVMSEGKSYVHKIYANMNSTSFHMGETPFIINFLNTGYFFDKRKVQVRVDYESRKAVPGQPVMDGPTSNLKKLLLGSLPRKQQSLLIRYISYWKKRYGAPDYKEEKYPEVIFFYRYKGKLIKSYRNYFLPTAIGGLGIEAPLGYRFKITKSQKFLASFIIGDDNYDQFGPSRLYTPDSISRRIIRPWDQPDTCNGYIEFKLTEDIKKRSRKLRNLELIRTIGCSQRSTKII